MAVFTKIWEFIKKYWQIILLVCVVGGGYAWVRHQQSVSAALAAQLDVSHQQEIAEINKARAIEVQQHAEQLKKLQDSIAAIQAQYVQAQAQIDAQQAAQVTQIVKKYGNDAAGLTQLLADKFGFIVVPPVP